MGFDKLLHLIAGGAITALAIGLGAGWPLAALVCNPLFSARLNVPLDYRKLASLIVRVNA